MIVTKENQRLYLSSWNYNMCRITTKLAQIIVNHGGRVKPQKYCAVISNRSISEKIHSLERQIESMKAASHLVNNQDAIKARELEIEALSQIKNDPITVTHTSYITFVFGDECYYYQMDDNPFFDFFYTKTEIAKDNTYSQDVYAQKDKKEWLYDAFFSITCSDADIVEGANLVFNMLMNAERSQVCEREKQRISVPNTYDGGYHTETIYKKERRTKIDF